MHRLALILGLVAFLAVEAVLVTRCLVAYGVLGTLARATEPVALVIVVDFTFVVMAVCAWIVQDARARGRSPWPWLPLVVAVPTLGLFLYVLTRPEPGPAPRAS